MLLRAIFCTALLATAVVGQRVRKQPNKQQQQQQKNCTSTYSFTVAEEDHMKCSHHAGGAGGSAPGGVSDAVITRRLLSAVNKLIQHNHQLEEARLASQRVGQFTDELQHQQHEMSQLVHRVTELQNQVM